jgi:hypothetical protein
MVYDYLTTRVVKQQKVAVWVWCRLIDLPEVGSHSILPHVSFALDTDPEETDWTSRTKLLMLRREENGLNCRITGIITSQSGAG